MGVPTSEVGYTSTTTGRGDHGVHKGHVVACGGGIQKSVLVKPQFGIFLFSIKVCILILLRAITDPRGRAVSQQRALSSDWHICLCLHTNCTYVVLQPVWLLRPDVFRHVCHLSKSGVDESLCSVLFLYYLYRALWLFSSITSAVLCSISKEKFDTMCTAQNIILWVLCLLLFLVDKK
jgi:hypothetical protein